MATFDNTGDLLEHLSSIVGHKTTARIIALDLGLEHGHVRQLLSRLRRAGKITLQSKRGHRGGLVVAACHI